MVGVTPASWLCHRAPVQNPNCLDLSCVTALGPAKKVGGLNRMATLGEHQPLPRLIIELRQEGRPQRPVLRHVWPSDKQPHLVGNARSRTLPQTYYISLWRWESASSPALHEILTLKFENQGHTPPSFPLIHSTSIYYLPFIILLLDAGCITVKKN